MKRSHRFATAFVLAASLAGAAEAQEADDASAPGRFSVAPSPDGFVRIDTRTGHASHCTESEGVWRCTPIPEVGERLEMQVRALTDGLKTLEDRTAATDDLAHAQELLGARVIVLEDGQEKLGTEVAGLADGQEELADGQEKLSAEVGTLSEGQDALAARADAVAAGLTDLETRLDGVAGDIAAVRAVLADVRGADAPEPASAEAVDALAAAVASLEARLDALAGDIVALHPPTPASPEDGAAEAEPAEGFAAKVIDRFVIMVQRLKAGRDPS